MYVYICIQVYVGSEIEAEFFEEKLWIEELGDIIDKYVGWAMYGM